jgi:hypothetical protein
MGIHNSDLGATSPLILRFNKGSSEIIDRESESCNEAVDAGPDKAFTIKRIRGVISRSIDPGLESTSAVIAVIAVIGTYPRLTKQRGAHPLSSCIRKPCALEESVQLVKTPHAQ